VNAKEIQSLMDRSRRSLRSARNLLNDGDHDFAVSRAYYAMFYAATAALLCIGIKRTKHSGVIAALGRDVVKPGYLSVEHQQAFQAAFADRTESDYAGVFPDRPSVEIRLKEARDFVEAVSQLLREKGVSV
jgi:uncharacterized protein (UPF0332 family)